MTRNSFFLFTITILLHDKIKCCYESFCSRQIHAIQDDACVHDTPVTFLIVANYLFSNEVAYAHELNTKMYKMFYYFAIKRRKSCFRTFVRKKYNILCIANKLITTIIYTVFYNETKAVCF